MTPRVDLPGIVLFLVLLVGIGWLALTPAPPAAALPRALLTFEVDADAPLELEVPPDVEAIKLVTIARIPAEPWFTWVDRSYALDVVWLDDAGEIAREDALRLASPPAVGPAVGGRVAGTELLEPRTTRVEVPSLPGRTVSTVRVTVPAASPPVRVRAFREDEPPLGAPELALASATERNAVTWARQLGLPAWSDVRLDEALALAATRWEALVPRHGVSARQHARVTRLPEQRLPTLARRALPTPLLADEALTWTLTGPVEALLVHEGPAEDLEISGIAEDLGRVPVVTTAAQTPPWTQGLRALWLRVEAEAEVTLHARAGAPTSLQLLISPEARYRLPVHVEAVPVAVLTPTDAPHFAVAPTRRIVHLGVPGPARPVAWKLPPTPADARARLSFRPVRVRGEPDADARVEVVVRRGDEVLVRKEVVIPWTPSPYEHVGPADAPPRRDLRVGEPVERFVAVPRGADELSIHQAVATDAVLVGAAMPGPPRGQRAAWDATRRTTVRYLPDARSDWRPLDPPTDASARWSLHAQQRRELRPIDGRADEARVYETLDPVSSRAGRAADTWLFPPSAEAEARGLVWCPVAPSGRDTSLRLSRGGVEQLGGVLGVALWPPERALGAPWELRVDGTPWASGVLDSAVVRHQARIEAFQRVRVSAPPGTRTWLRTVAEGTWCDDAHRARRLVPASGAVRWVVGRTLPDPVLVVGGAAEGDVVLEVTLAPRSRSDLPVSEAWTLRRRLVLLPRRPDARAVAMDRPWQGLDVLEPAGIVLHDDLSQLVDVTIRQVDGPPARVYVSVERPDDGTLLDPPSLRRVSP